MATITYIVLPSIIKERMSLHDNIDDKLIYPEIMNVQEMYVLPLLGSNLYNKIMTDIANTGTLTGNYKTLMDSYLVMAICNWVMSELPPALNYQYWNKGVSQKTVDNADQPSMSDLYSIMARYKTRAEHYSKRARMYLIQNAAAMFPEYLVITPGVDQVVPENQQYSCPIFLGDETEIPRDDYSLGLRKPNDYNSNFPFYT